MQRYTTKFQLLARLNTADGPLSLDDLAKGTDWGTLSLQRAIARLRRQGLVERVDGVYRAGKYQLTEKGRLRLAWLLGEGRPKTATPRERQT